MRRRAFLAASATLAIASGAALLYFRRQAATPTAEITGDSVYLLESAFVTDDGRTIRLSDLRGRFQILALIFTRCPRACPTLVKELKSVEHALPKSKRETTRFALITIDPEHDTPPALHAYRERMGLGEHWTLLRGAAEAVRELAASIGFGYGDGEGAGLLHSKLVTVLDPRGVVVHQQVGLENDRQRLLDALEWRTQ